MFYVVAKWLQNLSVVFLYTNLNNSPCFTGRNFNVHKTFRRSPGHLRNILCMFSLRPVSMGYLSIKPTGQMLVQREQ